MKLAGVAAICCAMALVACERAAMEEQTDQMTRSFMAMRGIDYDIRLEPAEADPRGAMVVTRSRLMFENGPPIELYQVGSGIYRTPSLRSWHGARGSGLCDGQPVAYLALHRGPGDLFYLNAGNWATAPALPGSDMQAIPGACETTTYRASEAGATSS